MRAGDRHVLEVAVLHLLDARRLLDLGLIILVEPHVARDRDVGQLVAGHVALGRRTHVRPAHLETHEREGAERLENLNELITAAAVFASARS